MVDFRMELERVGGFAFNAVAAGFDRLGAAGDMEVGRVFQNRIPVRHPDLAVFGHVFEYRAAMVDIAEVGPPVFPALGRGHFAAAERNQELSPVADGQHRVFASYVAQVGLGCVRVVDRIGASRQDDPFDVIAQLGDMVVGVDFAVDVVLADFAGNQLGVLRPEVQNQDAFLHGGSFFMAWESVRPVVACCFIPYKRAKIQQKAQLGLSFVSGFAKDGFKCPMQGFGASGLRPVFIGALPVTGR